MRGSRFVLGVLTLVLCLAALGCGAQSAPDEQATALPETPASALSEAEAEAHAAEIAKLPAGEQDAARAQAICPVSEEPLGSMGVPVKVAVKGRDVFICCEGCRKMLERDAEKYLAKLDEK